MKIIQIVSGANDELFGLGDDGNTYVYAYDTYEVQEYSGSIPRLVTKYKNRRWELLIKSPQKAESEE